MSSALRPIRYECSFQHMPARLSGQSTAGRFMVLPAVKAYVQSCEITQLYGKEQRPEACHVRIECEQQKVFTRIDYNALIPDEVYRQVLFMLMGQAAKRFVLISEDAFKTWPAGSPEVFLKNLPFKWSASEKVWRALLITDVEMNLSPHLRNLMTVINVDQSMFS